MPETQPNGMPIAIVGMGCRFAGNATSPEKLWEMLEHGESAWSEIPSSRFNLDGWYHPNHENISTTNVRGGHFLKQNLGLFDANFFGLSAETASTMDPQYRLLLEAVYEALENAGMPLDRIAKTKTSVFSGAFFHDYQDGHMRDAENLPRFLMTGNGAAMASNRISHFFDLLGPSMTIDTGCSTTLTALHQACQGLRGGDADMSIVGGSNLLINPDYFVSISTLGMLSKDGKSYSFDSRANGYGRGEGVAAIVLKRLEDAVKSGDPIRAVIRDTHLNQDGKTETITSPSRHAQEQLIRECYEKADIDPSCTQYFEAHGTGTPTGDPIEVSAIASVFHEGRSCKRPLYIGSVKTNLGHTEPTSGLASVIKVTLALERKIIPPSINFEEPNERLTLDKWNLKVPVQCTSWPVGRDGTRRASVNNFGYGGANAHVIMEDWTLKSSIFSRRTMNRIVNRDQVGMIPPQLFILSAKDENSCRTMASNMEAYLRKHNPDAEKEAEFLNNLAFTLGERRSRFSWASVYQASSISELGAAFGNEKLVATRAGNRPRIGFIFTGQGAQWHAMGRELLDTYPVFKSSILEAEQYLKEFGCKWSLLQELCRDAETTRVAETLFGMPVCTAVQISLVRLLDVWGITPTAVCSHSSGEIAAAYAVGALSYRSAMAACYSRCEIGSELIEMDGGMIAVGLDISAINDYLKIFNVGEAKIACINSPSSVTVSGDITAIEQLEVLLKGQGIFARRLRVRTAFHSHHMQPLYEPYMQSMQERMETGDQALLPIIYASPTTGMRVKDATQLSSPQHWAQSMIKPVLFLDAFRQMALNPVSGEAEIDIAVEVGPHAALSGPVGDILLMPEFCKTSISYLSCLIRDNNAVYTMQALAAQLLCKGVTVNLKGINFPTGKDHLSVITDLPSYPWNHQMRHWDECRANKSHRVKQFGYHDLIGSLVDGTNFLAPTWRHTIRLSDMPWVREHTVQSNVIYPGAGYICMAIEAARQLVTTTAQNINGYRLRDVDIMHALIIPDGARGVEVQLSLQSVSEKAIGVQGWREFKIYSVGAEDKWTEHCKGLILVEFLADSEPISHQKCSTLTLRPCYLKCVDAEDIYSSLRTNAIYHGKIFQNIESVQVGQSQAVVVLSIPNVACMMPEHYQKTHVLHPITLDSVFVSAYGALLGSNSKQESSIVPKRIKSLWVSGTIGSQHGHQFKSYVKIEHVDYRQFKSKITMFDSQEIDDSHPPVLVMDGFLCQSLGVAHCREPGPNNSDICSKLNWAPDISLMSPGVLSKQLSFALDTREEQTILNLRRACFHYIHDALASLTLADIQRLEWHHKKFYTWMKLQVNLALDDELAASSSEWIKDNEEEKRHLFDIVGLSSVNGEAVCHLGTHLLSILTQKATPLELLMEGKLLHKYYRGALKFSRCNIQLAKLAKHLIHKNPRAKILEIGAGTGGTTQSLLEVIGNGRKCGWGPFASEYHFTDISSGFFAESQDQYGDWSDIMTYRKLDIELDPAQQGFECGSYDIIVAGQVLHATKTMRSTMRNVRSLLKPGGKLLLMESTKDQMDMQFVFGLLPGEDERETSPILSVSLWDKVLKSTGFSGCDLDIHDCEREDVYTFSVIMSTAIPDQLETSTPHPIALVTNTISLFCYSTWMKTLQDSVATVTDGSLISVESIESVDATGKFCIFLGDIDQSMLLKPSAAEFRAIVSLVLRCKGLLWVTRGGSIDCKTPQQAISSGFLRTLRLENTQNKYISLDLDPQPPAPGPQQANAISKILACVMGSTITNSFDREFEFAERDGTILIPRLVKDFERNYFISAGSNFPSKIVSGSFIERGAMSDRILKLDVKSSGLLETLTYKEILEYDTSMDPEYIEIEPRAFGLNFRDVMAAMGQLNETVMGLECSGVITRVGTGAASHGFSVGCHVIALVDGKYQNRIQVPWIVACPMSQFDFVKAASIPMVFTTAYISLYDTAKLYKGQSILIHAATGGVGQAAIMLAQHLGAEIFATAGSSEKRKFITSKFGVSEDHVFSSRDRTFGSKLMSITGGQGVNVVLNCLSGKLLQESFNCLAPFGHFVEIGKFDSENNNYLEMAPFTRVTSFSSIDILALVRLGSPIIHRTLTSVSKLLEQGLIHPVDPIMALPLSDVEKAFRLMQVGKHMGKIILSVDDCVVPYIPLTPSVKLRPDASYLIAGGVGGIGKSIAEWLLAHGAKSLILMSRSATTGASTTTFVAELEKSHPGSKIKLVGCDISKESELVIALDECVGDVPPIRGVVQAAMVLQDSILENMSMDDYNSAMFPKVQGTWNLHQHIHGDLEFFILLSSLAGVIGNPSQSNYTGGGAFQDALARYRVSKGLPGVSLDIGAVKNVGYVASNKSIYDRLEKMGFRLLGEDEILSAFESAILYPSPQIMVGINTAPSERHDTILGGDARFDALRYIKPANIGSNISKPVTQSEGLAGQLSCASSLEEASGIVLHALVNKLADIFMIPMEEVVDSKSMADFGVDSLVAVELRNMLAVQAGAEISIFNIMQSSSLAALSHAVASASTHVNVS